MITDQQAISSIDQTVDSMVNPFKCESTQLISPSSGAVASQEVTSDLLNAERIGEEKLSEFILARLPQRSTEFFDTIKANKLKTFSSNTSKTKRVHSDKVIRAERSTFINLLLVARERERLICEKF